MAYSKIQIPGNGTNGPFTVSFALGYLSQSEVTARVNAEVDGLGAPLYRTITWLDVELVNISGTAPTALDTITFERTVSKTVLKHDFADGAPIIERNLDESHKQAIMIAQEALDGRFGAFQGNLDAGNHYIINVLDPVNPQDAATKAYIDLQVISAGNVPAPTAPDVNKVLTATGVGTWAWGTPVVVPAATESVAGIAEIATDAEVTTGTDNTNKFLNVLKAVTAFGRKAAVNVWTGFQTFSGVTTPVHIVGTDNAAGNGGPFVVVKRAKATPSIGPEASIAFHTLQADLTPVDAARVAVETTNIGNGVVAALLQFITSSAGALATRAFVGLGFVVGSGSDMGAGTVNAASGLYARGHGAAGPSACFAHESTGNGGSTVATTWTICPLTLTRWNNIAGASLSSNQVTLPAGRYRVRAQRQFHSTGGTTLIRLFNVTDGALIVNGPNWGLAAGGYDIVAEIPTHEFTIASSKVIRVDYYVEVATATTGLGNSTGVPASHNNTYGYLFIEWIAG